MVKIITIILVIVLFVLTYLYLKSIRRKKAALIIQTSSEKIIDDAMHEVMEQLNNEKIELIKIKGDSVAKVWGPAVVGYNYQLRIGSQLDINTVNNHIKKALNDYCQINQLVDEDGPLLRISDEWVEDHILQIDIVYLINQATKDYLTDLSKLN